MSSESLRFLSTKRFSLAAALSAVLSSVFVPNQAALADRYVITMDTIETLGSLTFDDDEIADYDPPPADSAVLLFNDNLFTDDEDINAVHVLDNGNIVLSAVGTATLGGLTFGDDDLAEYNPVSGIATRIFDGGAVLTNFSSDEDVDAVFVRGNGNIILSTTNDNVIAGVNFGDDDLVEYDPVAGTATIIFDGGSLFSQTNEDIDAVHILANGNIVLSTTGNATLAGLSFNDDDLIEYDPVAGTATRIFDGGNLIVDGNGDVNGIYVIENLIDHFAINHDGSADICNAENIIISKHDSSHTVDTNYSGTVSLSTSTNNGDWSLISGAGTLTNSGNGAGSYSFAASDNGQVTLGLRNSTNETLNIDITDGAASEDANEDPDLNFSGTVSETFRDEFTTSSFSNNHGTLAWSGAWIESDVLGAGPGSGNVRIAGGVLSLDDDPNTDTDPSLARETDLSAYNSANFTFDFQTIGGVDPGDSVFIEVSNNGGGSWTLLENITGINDTTRFQKL